MVCNTELCKTFIKSEKNIFTSVFFVLKCTSSGPEGEQLNMTS